MKHLHHLRTTLTLMLLFPFVIMTSGKSTITVTQAGTLPTLLNQDEQEATIIGPINGTDIKYLRTLVNEKRLTSIDLSEARIISGGDAYLDDYYTEDDVIGKHIFYGSSNLKSIILPKNTTIISTNAFSHTGLTKIDIPDRVYKLEMDAFAYCKNLSTVIIGRNVTVLHQGVFYSSNVKNAYVKPEDAPATPSYLFSSKPTIQVYSDAIEDYQKAKWNVYGTLKDGLENMFPKEADNTNIINELATKYFEDAACTVLKPAYQSITDATLKGLMNTDKAPSYFIDIAIKIKNNDWKTYEKDFRIHNYNAYSDANYWNDKFLASGGSYMGNPTGIYTAKNEDFYVFVDQDIPEDASLYIAGCVDNELVMNAKSGKKLKKGFNVVCGIKNALYYIIYTADTKSGTKKLNEWQGIKIHIEGGVINGYYDVTQHNPSDYKAILKNATHERFTVKGAYSLFNFKTSSYKSIWPTAIDKCIAWFDSITVWQKELMGFCESVASGSRNVAPYNLSGGEAYFPSYYNNPNFAVEGEAEDAGWANSTTYRTMYNTMACVKASFNLYDIANHDDWCAGHECGHNNQHTINLEGCGEVSNNLFANVGRLLTGHTTPTGHSIAKEMTDFAYHTPFYARNGDSRLRMYYQLYLYYHQARKNTSFYPTLFKALREDRLVLGQGADKSTLKFVRKVCEVAQEDLTDFFEAWGFFEPCDIVVDDYGNQHIIVKTSDIAKTKAEIAKYPKKNKAILFIEDRAEYMLTNNFFTTAGKKRRGSDQVGQYGDLGQFTDYLSNEVKPSSYTYIQTDSLYAMKGEGGIGFIVLNNDDKFIYGSNALNFCIPTCVGNDFKIYSMDADGTLHETTKSGEGKVTVDVKTAGTLSTLLPNTAIHATITGPLNGTDIKYIRQLIQDNDLVSLDLSSANIVSGGMAYSGSLKTENNVIGEKMFQDCPKLISITLPISITKIKSGAFSSSKIQHIVIPDNVTSLGFDAFAYCKNLAQVYVGKGVKNIEQGVFYSSNVKDAYFYTTSVPKISIYFFSSNPNIHVYEDMVENYKEAGWEDYGTIVGDLQRVFPPTEIALSEEEITIKKNETHTFNTILTPVGATCELIWESTDPSIAKVIDGKVTGVAKGDVLIFLSVKDNPSLMAMCFVSVTDQPEGINNTNFNPILGKVYGIDGIQSEGIINIKNRKKYIK